MEHNTDLIVLRLAPVRIACRVRRFRYYAEYSGEITVREGHPSGAKTELTKIIEGWGDYFFYGFADAEEKRLVQWVLCSLNHFRIYFNRYICGSGGELPGTRCENADGTYFRAFRLGDIPGFVIAQGKVT